MDFNNGFFEALGRSPAVRNLVVAAAEDVAEQWRADAPEDTGAYKSGIGVRVKYQKRVVAEVVSADKKTMLLESKGGYGARALQKRKRSTRG